MTLNNIPTVLDEVNIVHNFTLQSNRITKTKAKLEYNFDCTNFKADQNIPCANERLHSMKLSSKVIELKDDKEVSYILEMNEKQKFSGIFESDENHIVSFIFFYMIRIFHL